MIVRATVKEGRFVIDEPAELPEGTTVEMLVVEEPLDEISPDERAALLASLDRGIAELESGAPISADQMLRQRRYGRLANRRGARP